MPSTYSPNLRIELIASGEQANQWGLTTNNNLGTLIEDSIAGLVNVSVTAGDVTLTALDGVADQSRNMILNVTGTPGVARTITAPAVSKVYVLSNNSNDDVEIVTSAGGSTGITVTPGTAKLVYSDGTDFFTANDTSVFTPDSAIVSDALGILTASPTSATELSYLQGTTSNVQQQINYKFAAAWILGN